MATRRLTFARDVWKDMLSRGGVEKALFPGLQIHAAQPNLVTARLQIDRVHTNRLGIVHGGVLSTLVDVGGSLALASQGMFMTGVTTDLATTFLAAGGKAGDWIQIDCALERMGRTMAFTFVTIRDLETQRLVARGSHTKHIAHAMRSPQNVDPATLD